jgi:hypothetical protein
MGLNDEQKEWGNRIAFATNWLDVSERMIERMQAYVLYGHRPGDFLSALLCNDFMQTVGRADDRNRAALAEWARLLYNEVPSGCYGSPAKFEAWIAKGGLSDEASAVPEQSPYSRAVHGPLPHHPV